MAFISSGDCNYFLLFFQYCSFCLFLSTLLPPSTSLSFNFTNFSNSIVAGRSIVLQGDATLSDPVIRLTLNTTNRTGGVIYNTPVQLWDNHTGYTNLTNFTTHFIFTLGEGSAGLHADGLTFFLAPNNSVTVTSGARHGAAGLGLFDRNGLQTNNSVIAAEFDTYWNDAWDPNDNHIGIDISSVRSVNTTTCFNSTFWEMMRAESQRWEAWVEYDSSSHNLSVALTCVNKSLSCGICSVSSIVDLRNILPENVTVGFSSSTGNYFETHQLNSWDFKSSLELIENSNNNTNVATVVGLAAAGGVGVISTILGFLWVRRKKQQSKAEDDVILDVPTGPREFTYVELARATRDFDEEQKLGEGGFGGVYRGFLSDLNKDIAVKRISKASKQGTKEYASEVKIISRLRHRNLVQLIGWSHQKKEFLLVYEFMPNGSLDFHLFRDKGSLTWDLRYKIALDLAFAIQYLHEGWEQCIVHRDIKSSNIILDTHFNAKLGDFGLAKLMEHEKEYPQAPVNIDSSIGDNNIAPQTQTTNIAGTMGYMAPEYVFHGKATKESDTYSFGIVLLEIACGRRSVEYRVDPDEVSLVNWVWELYGTQRHLEAADPSQCMDFDERKVECLMIVGLWCAHPNYKLRPSIDKAIHVLQFDAPLPILPSKMPIPPSFNLSTFSISSSQPSYSCSTTNSSKLDRSSIGSSSPSISLLSNPQ